MHRKTLPSFLFFKKQQIFHLPSSFDTWNYLAFVTSERNILLINIPVPGLQLLDKTTLGYFLAA